MKYLTVYCLLFALMPLNISVSAKCRKKGQGKEAATKAKQTQASNQNNATSHEVLEKNSKTNQTSGDEENIAFDTSSQSDQIKDDDKTMQTNVTQNNDINLPSEFGYPYEFDMNEETMPTDKSSHSDKIKDADRAIETNYTQPSDISLSSEVNFPKEINLPPDSNSPGQPDQSREDTELGYHGYLYDVFKKRLNQVFQELYHNVNSPSVTAPPPQTEFEIEKPKKRSAVSNCLYEEFKRRLDKFNNEFLEPAKAIKRTSGGIYGNRDTTSGKRSTVQENMYEEYKRRLDKLGNELWLDGEKVFDRTGRDAPGMLLLTTTKRESQPNHSETDKSTEQDFYEEYKKKLDQLTHELYKKSNERISRTYTQLTEHDLTSPTLQRLVEAVQLDDSKSVKVDSRDGTGSFEGSTYLLKIDKAIDELNKQQDKRSLGGANDLGSTIFGADSLNFMTGATSGVGATAAASYPAVLTRTVDANLGMLGNTPPKNMLATVASKMNMTTLDLAKKLASMSNPLDYVAKKDPQLGEEMQKLLDFSVSNKINQITSVKKPSVNEVSIVSGLPLLGPDASGVPAPLMQQDALFGAIPALAPAAAPAAAPPPAPAPTAASTHAQEQTRAKPSAKSQSPVTATSEAEATRIAAVLDKVLSKLEHMQECKAAAQAEQQTDENCEPDGMPCDVVGSWNSYEMGLRFDIALSRAADRRLGMAEKNNKLLSIEVGERMPPRAHHIIDTSWKFMGSALNQQGGPFYIYSQNRELSTVTTFIGYCRVCGGIDTIFGSWTIMGPSKDCQDVSTALENRRDIFRRYNMENKRNKHFKDMLFEKSKYAKPDCDGK